MNHESSSSREVQTAGVPAQRDAMTRRRMLLKGLGKGGAVVAVAAPITSFAVPSSTLLVTATNQLCSQSGQNSLVHSTSPTAHTTCEGHTPSFYATAANWPSPSGLGLSPVWADAASASIQQVLGSGDSTAGSAIAQLTTAPTSDLSYWIAAVLNSIKDTNKFPYTPAEVRGQYATDSSSVQLYKNYLSTLTS